MRRLIAVGSLGGGIENFGTRKKGLDVVRVRRKELETLDYKVTGNKDPIERKMICSYTCRSAGGVEGRSMR